MRVSVAVPRGGTVPATTTIEPGFAEVLAAARGGDSAALGDIFRAYQPRLLRYLRAQEREMADDLAADVWVAVARGLDRFTGEESGFRSWLFTIARHRVIEHRRRRARRRTESLPSERLDSPVERGWGGDPAWLVVEQLGAQRAVDELTALLAPDQAEAVLLRILGGFDVAEVARIMGRSPGNVRVLCHRALKRLAREAEAGAGTGPAGTTAGGLATRVDATTSADMGAHVDRTTATDVGAHVDRTTEAALAE